MLKAVCFQSIIQLFVTFVGINWESPLKIKPQSFCLSCVCWKALELSVWLLQQRVPLLGSPAHAAPEDAEERVRGCFHPWGCPRPHKNLSTWRFLSRSAVQKAVLRKIVFSDENSVVNAAGGTGGRWWGRTGPGGSCILSLHTKAKQQECWEWSYCRTGSHLTVR